jgi:hypothetical protein
MKTENVVKALTLGLVLSSAVFAGCRLGFRDSKIGTSYQYNDTGEPVRQKAIMGPGDTIASVGGKPWLLSKQYWYIRYTDRNNNGYWDKEIDKLVIHLPASDPQVWRFYDHKKRGDLVLKRYCFSCRQTLVPSPYGK